MQSEKNVEADRISVTFYFQTSSKDILLSVSLPLFSCPPCLEYLCPRALILLRLWRYINHVLTYLLKRGVEERRNWMVKVMMMMIMMMMPDELAKRGGYGLN